MKEIVIKVSDELLSFVYRNGFVPSEKRNELNHAILECVELPEGHGELKDATKALAKMQKYHDDCDKTSTYTRLGFETAMGVIEEAEVLVEADKQ